MLTYAAIALTCWLCAFIAAPARPRFGNEVAELVYVRLLGRQHRLVLLAAVATAALFLGLVITLTQSISADSDTVPGIPQTQSTMPSSQASCYGAQQDPTWLADIAGPPTIAGQPTVCRP
jgi:hypothetical protein